MQMQGFFNVSIDNVKTSPLMINYIMENIPDYKKLVVCHHFWGDGVSVFLLWRGWYRLTHLLVLLQ
jgi:hypothetical protein